MASWTSVHVVDALGMRVAVETEAAALEVAEAWGYSEEEAARLVRRVPLVDAYGCDCGAPSYAHVHILDWCGASVACESLGALIEVADAWGLDEQAAASRICCVPVVETVGGDVDERR